jgi:hypothetical protein
MPRPRTRAKNVGASVLLGLAFAAWLGCATSNGDPTGDDTTGVPTDTTPTSKPTSTHPEFEASFPGDDGGADPDGGSTDPDSGSGLTCNDPNDVGGSEPSAKNLGTITDNDSDGSSFSGVVNGAADIDFYRFTGTDTFGYSVDPTLTSASSGVEMCMYVACLGGSGIDFQGCTGGAQATSGIGNPGCCFTAPGSTTLSFNCLSTSDESATVFMRVKQTGNLCLPYTASYHY